MKRAPLNGARFLGGPNRPEKVILIPNPANCHFRMILPANPKAAAPPWYVRRNGCFPSIAYLSLLPTCFCLTDNVVHTLSRETACDITEDVAIFINHDIGIREALVKYGNSDGKHQEELGPEEAGKMLKSLGYEEEIIGRVLYLIGHHHTYSNIEGKDYRILVEADFLVNLYEDNESPEAVKKAYERIFRTESGRKICKTMFTI